MKTLLVLAALAAIALYLWTRRTPRLRMEGPVSAWVIPDQWSLNLSTEGGKTKIVRFNSDLGPVAGNETFRKKLSIAIPFTHPSDDGMPTAEEGRVLSDLKRISAAG